MSAGFFEIAERAPSRTALISPPGDPISFGELAAFARHLAAALALAGVTEGRTVAVMMENRLEYVALYAACVRFGIGFVGLNWHLTADEVRYILTDSGACGIVASESHAAAATRAADDAGIAAEARLSTGTSGGMRSLATMATGKVPVAPPAVRGGQVMFYTSGTTGRPKGVRKQCPTVPADEVDLSTGIGLLGTSPPDEDLVWSDEVHLIGAPLYHAAPLSALARALDSGANVVLMSRWTPEGFLELVERHRVTHASMVPTMFHRLMSLPDDVRRDADVSSLRTIFHSGGPCSIELKRRMMDWVGPILFEGYASTEGAGTGIDSEEWLRKPGSVGRASPGTTLKILDDEGQECPPGVPGHVYFGQSLWRFEYHNDPEKTRSGRRGDLFTVGDIGYVDDDGYLFLCDRSADVINSGGVNIYPTEIEAVLREHPGVADAAVIGAPNDEWGEEIRAIVEPRLPVADEPALTGELLALCRERLARYKCPLAVDFVDSLGRDPSGKLQKRLLRDRYWEGRARKI